MIFQRFGNQSVGLFDVSENCFRALCGIMRVDPVLREVMAVCGKSVDCCRRRDWDPSPLKM